MQRLWIAALALACAISPALAQDDTQSQGQTGGQPQDQVQTKPLTGNYYMAPSMDSEDQNAPNDHIFMTITGDAAKAMWDAMKVDTTPDECVGRMSRFIQNVVCYGPSTQASQPLGPDESPYECYLGVNLKSGQLEVGQDC
jgi:hypothetical protein